MLPQIPTLSFPFHPPTPSTSITKVYFLSKSSYRKSSPCVLSWHHYLLYDYFILTRMLSPPALADSHNKIILISSHSLTAFGRLSRENIQIAYLDKLWLILKWQGKSNTVAITKGNYRYQFQQFWPLKYLITQ